uniref:TTKRSYEDQ domain-containing protein n=1 Tax=Glossina austeni TaxID=7395 RepID=A0A1A9VFN2_GLOAU
MRHAMIRFARQNKFAVNCSMVYMQVLFGPTDFTLDASKSITKFSCIIHKYEELLRDKHSAESHLNSYKSEVDHLQNCLENATQELKAKDEQIQSINQASQLLEDELATTRVNYEEQISVLAEQSSKVY